MMYLSVCLCVVGGQVVQFPLASCGQDSHLKIWAINMFSSGGTVASFTDNEPLSNPFLQERAAVLHFPWWFYLQWVRKVFKTL